MTDMTLVLKQPGLRPAPQNHSRDLLRDAVCRKSRKGGFLLSLCEGLGPERRMGSRILNSFFFVVSFASLPLVTACLDKQAVF